MTWFALLIGCQGLGDTGDDRLHMGRISGTISIDPALAEDLEEELGFPEEGEQKKKGEHGEYPTVFAIIGIEEDAQEILPHRVHVTTEFEDGLVDMSVHYALENLFPQETPYVVIGMLDADKSVRETGQLVPTSGDVMSAPSLLDQVEIVVESGADIELDLHLEYRVE
jgi:hypothetical protein